MSENPLHEPILTWFDACARDLPWRRPDCTPWGVLVSEIMLQQTPVTRVLPLWQHWLARWPTPADLAAEAPGEAVLMWGRLGYPRRALRLHAAAVTIVERHDGQVPDDHDALLALPGIGGYTAAAVASFAFGRRHPVLDTNVRRLLARAVAGTAQPATASPTRSESDLAVRLLPEHAARAARWAAATMELGALVCTARAPAVPALPGERAVRLAAGGGTTGRRAGTGEPALRGHRPLDAGTAAGRGPGRRRSGHPRRTAARRPGRPAARPDPA